ncbi:hypothetical protein WA556_002037, partial [Blastocystis sp. ATCC 50177/Nand II]
MSKPAIKLLYLTNTTIYRQLMIEEALLRVTKTNWCLVNRHLNPSIVMGLSGKVDKLINVDKAKELHLPVIKRFSGGGTVVVDDSTFCLTFVLSKSDFPNCVFPTPFMNWTGEFYKKVFDRVGVTSFALRENDYVFGDQKFAGNAQSFSSDRMLHHTSFLWDYDDEMMKALKHPAKQPAYRAQREHTSFLKRMKEVVPSKDGFIDAFLAEVEEEFNVEKSKPLDYDRLIAENKRKLTTLID